MPLASWYPLQWYGPAMGSAIGTVAPEGVATLRALGRLGATGTAVAFSPLARPTQGKAVAAVDTSVAFSPLARAKGSGRMGAVGRIGSLTQDDVTGAVLEELIEPGLTFRQAMRLVTAALAGKVSGAPVGPVVVRSAVADHKTRITATVDGQGNVSAVTTDTSQ